MCIVDAKVLQCYINNRTRASWCGCSAAGYGQCLGDSSQVVENGARVKGHHSLRQQRTERAMVSSAEPYT